MIIDYYEEILMSTRKRYKVKDKRLAIDDLCRELEGHRKRGEVVVFTNGCFDVIHAGHVRYLRAAGELGDVLVVGLNGDGSVARIKGEGRPVYGIDDRVEILSAMWFIDYLVVFEDDSVEGTVKLVRPDVLVKGGDYQSDDEVVGGEFVKSYGGKVHRVDFAEGRSSSETIRRMTGKKE